MYNGAYAEDVRHVLGHIQKKLAPSTPLVGIGFSLGSNILVKVPFYKITKSRTKIVKIRIYLVLW
jgi:predicted alpha/beta-fold hydrolase